MENINIAFSGQTVSIDSLFPDPQNARKHGEKSVKAIMKSLENYGQQKPVVVLSSGQIVAGHGMREAALRLGWKKIAVVVFEDPKKAKEYALVDNRTPELSHWNEDVLGSLAQEVNLSDLAGMDEKFIKKYVNETREKAPKEKKQIQCPHCEKWMDAPKRGKKAKTE